MGEVSKSLNMIKVTDAEKSTIYFIAPPHAKVVGFLKDKMNVANGGTADLVYFLKDCWMTYQIILDETPDTLADFMAWLFRSPDFKATDGSPREVPS
jgi:hypothetical protein